MNVKQRVLAVLEENKGKNISGSDLADALAVSRNAIWKSVKALQEEGYRIKAVTNKGYSLSDENDILSAQSIRPYLSDRTESLRIEVKKSVTSTNTVLKEYAAKGEAEGKLLIAEEQTSGRGRLGRSFFSPANTGIYMSVLLRPKLTVEDSLFITTAAAVAVARAIETITGVRAEIKWVNDIFCSGKKVCGILTEAGIDFESGGLEYAVLGIGINVARPGEGFPSELEDIITGVFGKGQYGSDVRSRLIAEVMNIFWDYYDNISRKTFLKEYRERSFLLGKEVNVITGNSTKQAVALDIDDDARLVVKMADGEIKALSSGEVSVKTRQ